MSQAENPSNTTGTAPAPAPFAIQKLLKFVAWIQIPLIIVTIVVYAFVWTSLPKLIQKRNELSAETKSLEAKNEQLLNDNQSLAKKSQELIRQVQASASRPGVGGLVRLKDLAGEWKNVDEQTRGLTRLDIRVEGENVFVHAWGKCHPSDCDWGEVKATSYAGDVSSNPSEGTLALAANFKTSFEESDLAIRPAESGTLQVESVTRFSDKSGRSSYAAAYTFRRAR